MKRGQRNKGQEERNRDFEEGPERQGTGAETVKRGQRDKGQEDRNKDCEEGPDIFSFFLSFFLSFYLDKNGGRWKSKSTWRAGQE